MLKRMILAALAAVFLACTPVFSQGRLGESPLTLRLSSAQSTAMGLTGAAYSEGLFSVAANPAGLAFLKKLELGFSHYPGTSSYDEEEYFNQETFAIALRVRNNTVASFNYLHFDYGFPSNGSSGIRMPGVSISHLSTLGTSQFSLGMTAKYFDERIEDFKANVFWFDVGARYKLLGENKESLSVGLSLSSFGNDLKDERGFVIAKPLQLLRAGLSYQTAKIGASILSVLATVEYQRSLRKDEPSQYFRWHHLGTGFEARFNGCLFGRFGYNFDLADVEYKTRGLTYGLGFTTPERFSKHIPLFLSLSYGRGLRRFYDYDQNVLNITAGFDY